MAKVLIDIPDKMYSEIKKYDGKHDVFIDRAILYEAVCNGIALDGLTNGEMFLTVFPQWEAKDLKNGMISVEFDGYYELFYKSWWNRKWGE